MRKFSKILAVLLTVCLLCGVFVSISASATEATTPLNVTLNVTGDSPMYNDFNGNKSAYAGERSWSNSTNGSPMDMTTVNGHLRLYRNPNSAVNNSTGAAPTYHISQLSYTANPTTAANSGIVTNGDYTTVDFDFGVDRWTYSYEQINDNGTADDVSDDTTETVWVTVDSLDDVPTGVEAVPAYYTMDFALGGRALKELDTETFSSALWMEANWRFYSLKKGTDGKWGIYNGSTLLSVLSNEVGVYDHFTFVIVPKENEVHSLVGESTGYSATAYFYINGKYVDSSTIGGYWNNDDNDKTTSAEGRTDGTDTYRYAEAICLQRLYFSFSGTEKKNDRYSFAFDNLAVNYYDDGYKSEDSDGNDIYGIDEFVTSGDYSKKALWNCEDIVYNANYVTPNSDRYIEVDGTKYYVLGAALDAIKTGSTVKTTVDILGYVPSARSFSVECLNSASFSLSADAAKIYDVFEDGNIYTVALNENKYADREWLNVSGEGYNRYNDFSTSGNSNSYGSVSNNNAETARAVKKAYVVGANGNGYWHMINNSAYLLESSDTAEGYITDQGQPENWYTTNTFNYNKSNHTGEGYKYITADIDIGTDRYAFTYEATVKYTTTTTTSGVTADPVTVTQTMTLNKTVGSMAEYEALKLDPSPLEEKSWSYTSRVKNGSADNQTVYSYEVLDVTKINDDIDFAFINGQSVALFHGRISTAALPTFTSGSEVTAGGLYTVKGTDGKWYLSTNATYSTDDILLSNELGVFDHVSYILEVIEKDGKIGDSKVYTFVNGNYVTEQTFLPASTVSFAIQSIKTQAAGSSHKNYDKYSLALDNGAINWFKSSAAIDAFLADGNYKTANLSTCIDAVYNVDRYINPNGWVSTDGGKTIHFIKDNADAAIAALANGGTITASRDLINYVPTVDSFTFVGVRGAQLTLDESVLTKYIVEKNGDVYSVRAVTEADAAPVKFYDSLGNLVHEAFLLPGVELTLPDDINVAIFDFETEEYSALDAWYLKGTETLAEGYSYKSLAEKPEVIEVEAKLKASALDFVIYTTNESGEKQLAHNASNYESIDNLKAMIESAPTGSTVVLLYDVNTKYDIGVQTNNGSSISIGAGKTINFDLNGRTLVDGYSNYQVGPWGDTTGCAFNVGEGSTFNFYSSKAGAVWYQLKYNSTSGDARVYSKGIVTSTAKNATVNFGSVYAGDKCVIKSEDFDVYGSLILAHTAAGATKDNTNFVVNVNGGNYHAFGIGRYAMISSFLPKITVNINDAYFMSDGAYATYGVFSLQAAKAEMYVNAYDSTFICPNSDTAKPTYHSMQYNSSNASGAYSEHYYEGCTVLAGRVNANKITLGEGNLISVYQMGSTSLADGVNKSAADINMSVKNYHPVVERLVVPSAEGANANFKPVVIDGTTYYTIADSVYDTANWRNTTYSVSNAFLTYAGDEMPTDKLQNVTYSAPNGDVIEVEKWHKDTLAINPTAPTSYDKGMYVANDLQWAANGEYAFLLTDYTVAGGFDNMLVNATLSTGMTYNIYVPADIEITDVTGGTLAADKFSYEGKEYYVISVELAAKDFAAIEVTATFSVASLIGGDAKVGTQALKADVVKYATDVASQYECGSEEASLVYEMMNYKEAVAKHLDAEYARNDATIAFYAVYAEHTECKCDVAFDASESEVADISDLVDAGIDSATFEIDEVGAISLVIKADAGLAIDVSYTVGVVKGETVTKTVMANYNEDSEVYVTEGIPAAYIDNILTITVGEAEGTYCLAAYIESAEGTAKNVATALYEYAMAAEAFKHVTKTEAAAQ